MKKITTILKTMFLATVVLVMAQSCIPNTPTGGNPTPTVNGFNVGISLGKPSSETHEIGSVVKVDGDSIGFKLMTYPAIGGHFLTWSIYFKSTSNYSYHALTKNGRIAILSQNINIPSDLDSTYSWTSPYVSVYDERPNMNFDLKVSYTNQYGVVLPPTGSWIYGNPNGYIILKSINGSVIQYYWIKIGAIEHVGFPTYTTNVYSNAFYIGRFNQNNIVSGI